MVQSSLLLSEVRTYLFENLAEEDRVLIENCFVGFVRVALEGDLYVLKMGGRGEEGVRATLNHIGGL